MKASVAILSLIAIASAGIAADKQPVRFAVIFEFPGEKQDVLRGARIFALQTEDTLWKGSEESEEGWEGNSWYGALAEDGKVRFENVKRGHYLLFHAHVMGLFAIKVGEYGLNKEVTIPVNLPQVRTCKVWLTLPPRGKPEHVTRVEVVVESRTGKALGYKNLIHLRPVGDRLEGQWYDVPEAGGTFQIKFAQKFHENPWVGIGLADITVTPKMVATGVIEFQYSKKDLPAARKPGN